MQLSRLDRAAVQAWRNGGGSTRELLAWPAVDDWVLRVSVARVDAGGPFSTWDGVERWFVVLQGAVELAWQDRVVHLGPADRPLRFDGGDAPGCRVPGGASEDLNLMVRRAAGRGGMVPALAGQPWRQAARWRGCFSAGPCVLQADGVAHRLEAASLAWCDDGDDSPWCLQADGALRAWWLHFEAAPR